MIEDAREYIREAQAAEILGDKVRAVQFLKKAADFYQREGKSERALQMLRHARRLGSAVAGEVETHASVGSESMPAKVFDLPDLEGAPLPATPLSRVEPESAERKLVERGPTLALPALRAWCSFCCRPSDEVGALVAGPAGAFVCASCLRESSRLLSPQPHPGWTGAGPTAPPGRPAYLPEGRSRFVGQAAGRRLVELAMRSEAQLGLILGPEGSGKTAYLKYLEGRGLGSRLEPDDLERPFPGGRLFIDGAEQLDAAMQGKIVSLLSDEPSRQVLLACRGKAPKLKLTLKSASAELPVYATSAVARAICGRLGIEVLERVEVLAVFNGLTVEELTQIARRMVSARGEKVRLSERAIVAIAKAAAASGRGGHELRSVIRRIPAGAWGVEKRRARKRRG